VEPLLSVIIFGVYDGNIEVLQISVNGGRNELDVVGLNAFELSESLDALGFETSNQWSQLLSNPG
jgi:hypothetical protein